MDCCCEMWWLATWTIWYSVFWALWQYMFSTLQLTSSSKGRCCAFPFSFSATLVQTSNSSTRLRSTRTHPQQIHHCRRTVLCSITPTLWTVATLLFVLCTFYRFICFIIRTVASLTACVLNEYYQLNLHFCALRFRLSQIWLNISLCPLTDFLFPNKTRAVLLQGWPRDRCRCNRYISNSTAASRGFHCDSNAFNLNESPD